MGGRLGGHRSPMEGASMGTKVLRKRPQFVRLVFLLLFMQLVEVRSQVTSEQQARGMASKFADQVVRIIPQRSDASTADDGFGVIVGERFGKAYIATPYHVVFGSDRPSTLSATPGVVLRGDPYNVVQAIRLPVGSASELFDLAVLEVTPPKDMVLPTATTVLTEDLPDGAWVWNIGINRDWVMPGRAGGSKHGIPSMVRSVWVNCALPPAHRRGATVTENGVVGIVLRDGGLGSEYADVLPIERIITLFTFWSLPVNLLSPTSTAPPQTTRDDGSKPKASSSKVLSWRSHAVSDEIALQLKWVTQAQFAGYYVAKDKGFYKIEGLDVTIKPGGPDIAPEQVLVGGGADVMVDWMPAALARGSVERQWSISLSRLSTPPSG
jgi:NMT1/THI5 like